MGSTHSTSSNSSSGSCSSSGVATTATRTTDSTPSNLGNCVCCLSPRPNFGQLWAKFRRTLLRHLRPSSSRKRRNAFQRGCGARTALLRPMPRCSSYGSCSTLIRTTPSSSSSSGISKRNQRSAKNKKLTINTGDNYAQWKCMFEHAAGKQTDCAPLTHRPHDISEALSGQTTPRGFPSHTDARRFVQQPLEPVQTEQAEQPIYDCVDQEKTIRRRLSFRLPNGSNQGSVRRLSARQRAAQARLEEQLQRELCDLEEYYGGFYYARRNERRI